MIDRPMTFQNFIIATRGRRVKDDQLILSAMHVAVVVAWYYALLKIAATPARLRRPACAPSSSSSLSSSSSPIS